jgi:hypothetical protein
MWLNLETRTGFFVNQIFSNNTFLNRKKYIRKRKTPIKYSCANNIDERISYTEHLNILNEYQEEIKYITQNQKNSDLDNTQSVKESSTRDSDIIICVDSSSPNQEKSDYSENNEFKKFKFQNEENEKNIEFKGNIFNLLNIKNSLVNKVKLNYQKVSNLVDIASNDCKIEDSNSYKNDKDKNSFENIKKSLNSNDEENSFILNLINKFYHFNFNSSSITKLIEKINNFLINQNSAEIKYQNNSIKIDINNEANDKINSKGKKDYSNHSNIIMEKMNNRNYYNSSLSLSTDQTYFNSIKYISNKIISNGEMMENNLARALNENFKLIKEFKEKNKEKAEKNDSNILKNILKNKQIRKKVKLKFSFLKNIREKKFYEFLDENNSTNKIESLMNKKDKNINKFLLLEKNEKYKFFIFVYFLLGISYIEKSNLNLSENELLSLIPYFIQSNNPKKTKHRILKKRKTKILETVIGPKKGKNIIRLNLEEIFGNEPQNNNSLNLMEDNK